VNRYGNSKDLEESEYSTRITFFRTAPGAVFMYPYDFDPFIERQGDSYRLKEGPVVYNRLIDVIYEELTKAVGSSNIIVLKGGWGIGKTIATYAALRKLIEAPPRGRRIVISESFDASKTATFLEKADGLGYAPVLYLTYSLDHSYSFGEYRAHMTFYEIRERAARLVDAIASSGLGTALIVLSNDQYSALSDVLFHKVDKRLVKIVDADEVFKDEKRNFARELVRAYCGCSDEAAERVADAAVGRFEDGYAVMAVSAARLIREGRPVDEAIREAGRRTIKYALDYIWSCIYGDESGKPVFYHHAPLIMAKGLLGPHFPQLLTPDVADEIARRASGSGSTAVEEDALRWLDSLRPGTALYEAIRGAAYGAVYRHFRVGNDEICRGSSSYSCYMVKELEEILYGLRHKNYRSVEEVARDYAKYLVSKAQRAAGRGLGLA